MASNGKKLPKRAGKRKLTERVVTRAELDRLEAVAPDAESPIDRDLLGLVRAVEAYATHGRTMLARGTDEQKRDAIRRLQRMTLEWRGLREHEGAPYPDARMLFVEGLLFYARLSDAGTHRLRFAGALARRVSSYYPSLEAKLTDPDRVREIAYAIQACVDSPNRIPWARITPAWKGIEAREQDAATWRSDWADFRKRT